MTGTQQNLNKAVHVSLELDPDKAEALAQFVKRVTWSEMRACAVDENETYQIRDAINTLQDALADVGYSPR